MPGPRSPVPRWFALPHLRLLVPTRPVAARVGWPEPTGVLGQLRMCAHRVHVVHGERVRVWVLDLVVDRLAAEPARKVRLGALPGVRLPDGLTPSGGTARGLCHDRLLPRRECLMPVATNGYVSGWFRSLGQVLCPGPTEAVAEVCSRKSLARADARYYLYNEVKTLSILL